VNTNAALTWGRSDWGAMRPGELLSEAGIDSYRSELRAIVRGLWAGSISPGDFTWRGLTALEQATKAAWKEGAARAGVTESEYTDEEKYARERAYWRQRERMIMFGDDVKKGSKANGGKLAPLLSRVELWVNQYTAVENQAFLMASKDQKLLWVVGPTEHCPDCAKYEGRVYRASTWAKYGIRPQSSQLACHGFRCQCRFEPSDLPANRGRPPAMTG